MLNEALVEDSPFNLLNIHLLSHCANSIPQYECLPQYSIEIYKAFHKALKDTYWKSNHMEGISQIIQTYSREHDLMVRQLEIEAWATEDKSVH